MNYRTTSARFFSALLVLLVSLLTHLQSVTCAQTNTIAAKPSAAAPAKTVFDFLAEMKLSKEQKDSVAALRGKLEAARTVVTKAETASNTPPDALYNARVDFTFAQRSVNKSLDQLLTKEQKAELKALRAGKKNAAAEKSLDDASPKAGASSGALSEEELEATSKRKKPRATLSDDEYKKLAAELRAQYAKPPTEWPAPEIDPEVKTRFVEIGVLPSVTYPADNPYSAAKTELGKKLFFDPRLSSSGQMACASCHDPDLALADGRSLAIGHSRKELKRNTPAIQNAGFLKEMFWDGRATSLEKQTEDVVLNADEFHNTPEGIRERLNKIPGYVKEFQAVFGAEPTLELVGKAIATFERTLTSKRNTFDLFARGETDLFSDAAVRGIHIFRTTGRCANCHFGPTFTDGMFHNEGLSNYGRKGEDHGRYEVTKKPADVGAFKTPSLRNVARTGPYMHHGMFDLETVLSMYNGGMPSVKRKPSQTNDPLFPTKSPLLKELGLNEHDLADLKAFLETLSETRSRMRMPELPSETAKAD
jgi:cytochrome c peroxidase